MSIPDRQSWPSWAAEAVGWLVASIWSGLLDIPRTVRDARPVERLMIAESAALILVTVAWAVFGGAAPVWFCWALATLFVMQILAELHETDQRNRERRHLERVLSAKPSGAPRVANVACPHGGSHRFIYGPRGWEETGPANHEDLEHAR